MDTFPIIHTFLLEGLPTCPGCTGLRAVTAGSACNSSNGSATAMRQCLSARRSCLPGNQWQCQDISHYHNWADTPGTRWLEAQDAVKHPAEHRMKYYSALNVNSVSAEKPWTRVSETHVWWNTNSSAHHPTPSLFLLPQEALSIPVPHPQPVS